MRNKEAVRSAIARIADDLGKGNITQEELDRARNPILNSMDRAQRDNGYWTSLLKDSQAKPERLNQQRESIPDVKAITVKEVNKLAKDIFGKGEHLNLNILPDHPAAETPPAEKQADQSRLSPGRRLPGGFLRSRHRREDGKKRLRQKWICHHHFRRNSFNAGLEGRGGQTG